MIGFGREETDTPVELGDSLCIFPILIPILVRSGGGLLRSQLGMLSGEENIAPAKLGGGLFIIPALIPIPNAHGRVRQGGKRCTRRTW